MMNPTELRELVEANGWSLDRDLYLGHWLIARRDYSRPVIQDHHTLIGILQLAGHEAHPNRPSVPSAVYIALPD